MRLLTVFQLFACLVTSMLLVSPVAIAQIEITDSHGKYRFESAPKRVVVLNWALAEQMLELGVTPVGMADVAGFTQFASKPKVPNNTVDVGSRLNPNLAKIRDLKPEIILIGYSQRPLIRPLSNIATVIYFKNFGKRYNNYQKSRERFIELARLFDKSELAAQKLRSLDSQLEALRDSLNRTFTDKVLPDIQLLVPSDESNRDAWLFGVNSMPYYAAKELRLKVLTNAKNDKFGVAKLGLSELNDLTVQALEQSSEVCTLLFSNYTSKRESPRAIEKIPLTSCSIDLEYQNAFGGSFSILYLAQAIHKALLGQRERYSDQ